MYAKKNIEFFFFSFPIKI